MAVPIDHPRGAGEPGYGALAPVPDLAAAAAAPGAAHVFGPDFYHLNFANDGPLPVGTILADPSIAWIALKFSQGVSYGDWAPKQSAAVRGSRAALGGYHMLDGSAGTGAQQADYFLHKYNPQPGDVEPCMDFEASGRGGASIQSYAARAQDFVAAIHAAGFGCTIYGHADVKAAWADWRQSGADHWWVPGDSPHNDVGPQGPDLWQFGPYSAPAGYPTDPLHNGQRADMSVVITALPIIGGSDEMTPAEKDALNKAAASAQRAEDYIDGETLATLGNPLPAKASDAMVRGFNNQTAALNRPKPGTAQLPKSAKATIVFGP